jgi:hypothetical protein
MSPLTYYLVEIFQNYSTTLDAFWSAIIVSITEIFGESTFILEFF